MLKLALVLIFSFGAAASHAETLGECAWSQVAPVDKQAILSAYQTSMDGGSAALQSRDNLVQAAVATCTKRSDVPSLWAQRLVDSQARQASAANALLLAKGIQRERLDAISREIKEAARQCARANAAKLYDFHNELCPASPASISGSPRIWESLKVSPTADRALAAQVIYYFYAEAQEETAETFIAILEQSPKPQ